MEFEISVEGPFQPIFELSRRVERLSPRIQQIPGGRGSPLEKARLVVLEMEERVDETLRSISRAVRKIEKDFELEGGLWFGTRNLAYSEPTTASETFKEPFKPIPSLTIQPWYPSLTTVKYRATLIIDPSHAFGTGTHPSTLLCLRSLERLAAEDRLSGARVLDFGCGTGLLALAAVRLGAACAVGVELDPDSALTAGKNTILNGLSHVVEIRHGSWDAVSGAFDLILANLVVSVLLRAGSKIPAHLNPGAKAVISGYGEKQGKEVETFFLDLGLELLERTTHSGWASLLMTRP